MDMDVAKYEKAIVNVWCGARAGRSGDINLHFEESTDQKTWTTCSGVGDPEILTPPDEEQFIVPLSRRWFRLRFVLPAADAVLPAWAVGHLEERTT